MLILKIVLVLGDEREFLILYIHKTHGLHNVLLASLYNFILKAPAEDDVKKNETSGILTICS